MKSAEDVATFSAETIPFHKKGAAVGSGVIGDGSPGISSRRLRRDDCHLRGQGVRLPAVGREAAW